jgi:hypothetical protein
MGEPLYIKFIDSQKMVLSDNSEWLFWPGMEPLSPWKIGDQISKKEKEGKFSIYRMINITRQKQEAGVYPVGAPEDISKSLGPSGSEKEYTNLGVEIKIKKASDDLIWLEDDSKWQMYNPTLRDPGPWEVGDMVIVTRLAEKSMSKRYQMKNLQTERSLMAVFMGYER